MARWLRLLDPRCHVPVSPNFPSAGWHEANSHLAVLRDHVLCLTASNRFHLPASSVSAVCSTQGREVPISSAQAEWCLPNFFKPGPEEFVNISSAQPHPWILPPRPSQAEAETSVTGKRLGGRCGGWEAEKEWISQSGRFLAHMT